ncbi:MAG TPA: hypothetical protein VGV67_06405, partial [Solirubrobacteraceae bacterium]|nr:hypothetical protein [Solirubrobacteraceae bacterium]
VLAPKREQISAVNSSIEQAEQRRSTAAAAAAAAEQARAGYQDDYATVARIGKAVPQDDDVASLVYQLETIAKRHDVDFRAVKLTAQTTAAAPAAEPAPAGEDKGEGDGPDAKTDDKAENGAEPAAAAPAAPVVAQPPPGAVVGTAGLLTVPFTFTFNGDYLKLQRFLKAIDGLANGKGERISVRGRLLTVDGFALAAAPPPSGFPKLKASISATAYLAPPADSPAAAPGQPAGAAGDAPTTTAMTSDAQGAGR